MCLFRDKMLAGLMVITACVSVSSCYPSKPLNERSTELAWQAWLLVDQANSRSSGDLTLMRKRITPKSVFVVPNFALPACSEGYRSDAMGRCVKIVKLDESIHFNFLLGKLKEQFPSYDDEEEEEEEAVVEERRTEAVAAESKPLQLNIPIFDTGTATVPKTLTEEPTTTPESTTFIPTTTFLPPTTTEDLTTTTETSTFPTTITIPTTTATETTFTTIDDESTTIPPSTTEYSSTTPIE